MNPTVETDQKYNIQWTPLLAYSVIVAVGVAGWVGIFHLASMMFK
jgi:hypothetical protein